MTLTKTDLTQIRKVVKESVRGFATKDDLRNFATKTDLKNFATKDDLKKLEIATKNDLKNFATKDDLKNEISPLKSDIRKIKNDINTIIGFFDREYLSLRARVDRIEDFIKIPPLTA